MRRRQRQHNVEWLAELRTVRQLRELAIAARQADEQEHQRELVRASGLLRPAREEAMNRCG